MQCKYMYNVNAVRKQMRYVNNKSSIELGTSVSKLSIDVKIDVGGLQVFHVVHLV